MDTSPSTLIYIYIYIIFYNNNQNEDTSPNISMYLKHTHTHTIYIYLYIVSKHVNWATAVKGNPKTLFSIVTTLRCKGECYFFIWIAPLTLNPIPYNAEYFVRRHHIPCFKSLVWLKLRLNSENKNNTFQVFILFTAARKKTICFCFSCNLLYIYIYIYIYK